MLPERFKDEVYECVECIHSREDDSGYESCGIYTAPRMRYKSREYDIVNVPCTEALRMCRGRFLKVVEVEG
jgi:hypothetical protein